MHLTTLDRRMRAKGVADGLFERLGPVDDEQAADLRIKPAFDQIIEKRLHHGGVFRGAFHHRKGVFFPLAIDADSRDKH